MRRTACAFAVAAVISAAAIGSSNAFPAAPLPAEVQTQTSDVAQVRWYPRWHRWHRWHPYWGYRSWYWHHAWYAHRYYYYGWYPAPSYYWGWHTWGWRFWL